MRGRLKALLLFGLALVAFWALLLVKPRKAELSSDHIAQAGGQASGNRIGPLAPSSGAADAAKSTLGKRPDEVSNTAISPSGSGDPGQISRSALEQIAAMQDEKRSFTPAQRKLSSQLVFALKQSRNELIAHGQVPQLRSAAQADTNGMIEVDIAGNITTNLIQHIADAGGTILVHLPDSSPVRASVPLEQLESLAALPEVRFIRQVVPPVFNNTDFEGVVTHRDDTARATFFADGSNVKVGVMSGGVQYLAQGQANGNLGAVTILPGQAGLTTNAEGTAMLEIVHAMAPGAQLFFATGATTDNQFATNILNLAFTYGCDVIVDDVTGLTDSPFQDTLIAQAVDAVTAGGRLYFSSSANSGNLSSGTSGTWEGDFLNGGAVLFPTNGFIHNFGTSISPTNYDTVTQGNGSSQFTILYWTDPVDHSTNDYDLFILNSSGTAVVHASVDWQNGPNEPIEFVPAPVTGERVVVLLASGANRFLHIDTVRGRLAIGTSGSTRGHNAATNGFSVAAVDSATAFPGPFTGGPGNPVETFSSDGPRRMFYFPDGTPMTPGNFSSSGGILFQKPDIAAADDITTDVPGFAPFSGTSAAAPQAAGIAALLKSYNTNLSAGQIRTILTSSALDIMAAGVDRDSGSGIAMAYQALQAAPAPPPLISVVSPASSVAGRQVFIYGTSFRTATSVTFNGAPASFSIFSNALIVATVPSGAASGPLMVTTPYGTASAPFTILPTPAPANDNFAAAMVVTGAAFTVSGYTTSATKEAGEPNHAGNSGGKSIWYRWVAPSSGVFSLDTIGSDFNTLLAVYTGNSVASLTTVASDNDSGGNLTSLLTFTAAAGTTYQIAVDGFGGASGNTALRLAPATTTIYSTHFEPSEGYNAAYTLAGQGGWQVTGSGWNGIVTNAFSGQGQQAYIGFNSAAPVTNTILSHPLNYTVDTNTRPVIQVFLTAAVMDSNNGYQDRFYLLFKNSTNHSMYNLVFDNTGNKFIDYILDNNSVQGLLPLYNYPNTYSLVASNDFGRNRWSASLNGVPVVLEQPITTTSAALTLGDFQLAWILSVPPSFGNNYLIFDNYSVTAGPSLVPKIIMGPQSQTVIAGSDVFLSVVAQGNPPLTSQWYYNSGLISGATNATLTLKNVTSSQTGNYSVTVTSGFLSASAGATVTITNPPPRGQFATPILSSSNTCLLNLSLAVGNNYRLQASTNLNDWSTLSSFYAGGTNALCLEPAVNAFKVRFYRLVSP